MQQKQPRAGSWSPRLILHRLQKVTFPHRDSLSAKEGRLHYSVMSQSISGINCFPWSLHQSSLLSFNREVYNLEELKFSRALSKES